MSTMMTPSKSAFRRYQRRLMILMTIYLVSLFGGLQLKSSGSLDDLGLYAAAIIPGVAIALVFWAIGRLIVELEDEFIKLLLVRQTLVATGFAFGLAALHGFLTVYGLTEKIDAYYWPITFFFGLFIGAIANRIQYGTWGGCK